MTQSTTATNGEAEKAVDGMVTPRPERCAKTDGTSSPYLVIDLGEEEFPMYIRIQLDNENGPNDVDGVTIRLGTVLNS